MSYYNSGLYSEPFYTKHRNIDFFGTDTCLWDEVNFNRELLVEHYEEELEYIENEDERLVEIDQIFWENLSYWTIYFEPLIFNEEIALKCELTPFEYKGIKLLALSGCGMDLSYKLDAYQLLTDNTIDAQSSLFRYSYCKEYVENIVGKDLIEEILKKRVSFGKSLESGYIMPL